MKLLRTLTTVFVAALAALSALAYAEERHLDFLRRLQEEGYGELAVEYVEQLEKTPDLPDDVREVLELEAGNSLRVAADEAANSEIADQRLADSQAHLDKFLQEHADHPAAVEAQNALGDIASLRGQLLIRQARTSSDKKKQEEQYKKARAALEQARPWFAKSVEGYQARLRQLAPAPATKKTAAPKGAVQKQPRRPTTRGQRETAAEREENEAFWLEARLKLALVDYYTAQTYTAPTDAARKAVLQEAAKGFDSIYQQYRTTEVGLYSHMWHGKTEDDLGNAQTALDIYDEVLANAPDTGQPRALTGLEPLFAQVELFRLTILKATGKTGEFVNEASEWVRLNAASRRTPGYQGIALEVAKAQIEQAQRLSGEDRRRTFTLALRALTEISKLRGEYQQEAFVLRRKYQQEGGALASDIASFDEGLSLGDSAASVGDWPAAASAYQKAIELGDKDAQRVVATRYRLAHALALAGKVTEAADLADQIARKDAASSVAPAAGALAVSGALALYAAAPDDQKQAALDRLIASADYVTGRWPNRPEADDARIALGQSHVVRGDVAGAIDVFEKVNPKSERYPLALFYAGRACWGAYLAEKQNSDASRDANRMGELRGKAEQRLTASLEAQRREAKPNEPLPRQLGETQLLLAEMALEHGDAAAAVPLLEPLVQFVQASKPQTLDLATFRTLVAALRAYVATGDLAKATAVQALVAEIGGDTPQVNSVLLELPRAVENQLKAAQAEATSAAEGSATEAAQARVQQTQATLAGLLDQVAGHQQHSLAAMVYIGDAYARLGLNDKARQVYQSILARAENEKNQPETERHFLPARSGPAAITRVRAQVVGLLRQEANYQEAMEQVTTLISENPRALEPLMEKGRILQAWAESEPKHSDAAVAHWSKLRTLLAAMQKKPPEYYEVVYNLAACLLAQYKQSRDASKLQQAEQLVKATLVLSPNLSGPDMVARYKALAEEVARAQGR